MKNKKSNNHSTPISDSAERKKSIDSFESFEKISPPQTINQFFSTPKKPSNNNGGDDKDNN